MVTILVSVAVGLLTAVVFLMMVVALELTCAVNFRRVWCKNHKRDGVVNEKEIVDAYERKHEQLQNVSFYASLAFAAVVVVLSFITGPVAAIIVGFLCQSMVTIPTWVVSYIAAEKAHDDDFKGVVMPTATKY